MSSNEGGLMTPKNLIYGLFTMISALIMSLGEFAYSAPNPPRYPGPVRPGPVRPPRPIPPRPLPPPPRPIPPAPPLPYPGDQEIVRAAYVGRYVTNERLPLRQMLNLGTEYRGYRVESLVVDVRGSAYGATLNLLVNGMHQDSSYSPVEHVVLYPKYNAEIGEGLNSLQLEVVGSALIDQVSVTLRRDVDDGYDSFVVPLYIYDHMFGNDALDLTSYIDTYAYQGYRIVAVDVQAQGSMYGSSIELRINGLSIGSRLSVDSLSRNYVFRPYNRIELGRGYDSIMLYSSGDVLITGASLRLSRY